MSEVLNDRYEDDRSISLLAEDQYWREVHWSDCLSLEEELKLLGRLARARREPGNAWLAQLAKHARDRLVEGYQPLVLSIAQRYARWLHILEFLDLVQEANIGLLRAIDESEKVLGGSLKGFAIVHIKGAIANACFESDAAFRIPSGIRVQLIKMQKVMRELSRESDGEPSVSEIAKRMGVSEWDAHELRTFRTRQHAESIQGMLREDENEDRHNFVSLFQTSVASENERQRIVQDRVQTALDGLTPYQREAVRLRYGFDGGLPLRTTHLYEDGIRLCSSCSIANELGISYDAAKSRVTEGNKRLRRLLASLYEEDTVSA